jgi:hypothetical protein
MNLEDLTSWQRAGYEGARRLWDEEGIHVKCPAVYKTGPTNRKRPLPGERCWAKAGSGTSHDGYGRCVAHGGAKREGRAEGAWLMAYAFAEEYDLSPWESLLYVIRITAGRVRYCEQVLSGARDHEIEGRADPTGQVETIVGGPNDGAEVAGKDLRWWVETSERERVLLAKVSKAAIDAGVAQLLVEQELNAGRLLADSHIRVYRALEASGTMSTEALEVARQVMQQELAATGSVRQGRAIEGEVKK